MCLPLPEGVPPARAVLAANLETALNVVWDAGVGPCDRVAVVGAGRGRGAGRLALRAARRGSEVTLVDVNPARAALAEGLGCGFAAPDAAPGDCDVVIHASASAAGLATALGAGGTGGDGGRGELVRRPQPRRPARRRVPQPAAAAGLVAGRPAAAGAGAALDAIGAGWRRRWRCCATRRSTR